MPSAEFNYAIHAISKSEQPIILLELYYAGLPNTLRLVNDNIDIASNGALYTQAGFNFKLPDSGDKQNPTASLVIDNHPEISAKIRQTHGLKGGRLILKQVMRSSPDVIEYSYIFDVGAIKNDTSSISIALNFDNLTDTRTVKYSYRPETAEGLFS
ncbi:MAG TPA: DUF1833 family protein [Bacteroidia bacterium]|nr:DUF1833 family protein [Bacteroidia bacterium]